MKVRSGFVSNSSSSSFLLVFPKEPSSDQEVFNELFKGCPLDHRVISYNEEGVSATDVAARVFEDIQKHKEKFDKFRLQQVFHEIVERESSEYNHNSLFVVKYADIRKLRNEQNQLWRKHDEKVNELKKEFKCKDEESLEKIPLALSKLKVLNLERRDAYDVLSEKIDKLVHEFAEKMTDEFLLQHDGKFMVQLTYGDENGEFESTIEHGNTFTNIPHLIVSQH